jgi:hypothetical protein
MEGFGNMTDTDFVGEMSSEDRARWPAPALSPTSASSPPSSWGHMQESPAHLGPLDPETTDLIRVLSPGLPRRVRHPPVPAGIPRDKHGSAQRADLSGYALWTTAKNASSARSSPSSSTKAKSSPGTASPLPLRPGRRIRAGVPSRGWSADCPPPGRSPSSTRCGDATTCSGRSSRLAWPAPDRHRRSELRDG